MQRRSTTWALASLAIVGFAAARLSQAADDGKSGVEAANAQFYAALNTLFTGDAGPMKAAWSHADDVTYMGPAGGMQVGWTEVNALWEQQAALKLGGKITAEKSHTTFGKDLAVVVCVEAGENEVDGKPQKVSIRATNTYRKEDGKWKMIGHHTDLLPFLAK